MISRMDNILKEKAMNESTPSGWDRVRIRYWPKQKALDELRKRALNGETEWVMLLVQKTNYETISNILDTKSWQGESTDNLRKLNVVIKYMLQNVPKERLPKGIDPFSVIAAFDQAVLRSLPRPPLLKKR